MKLWLLELKIEKNRVFWDHCIRAIVRSKNEGEARQIASKHAQDEGQDIWLDNQKSTCIELLSNGKPELIIQDVDWG